MASSPVKWGTLTSLYGGLETEQVDALEAAIKCRLFGQYDEANSWFVCSLEQGWAPVVVYELATMYDRMGLEHQRTEKLEEILAKAHDAPESLLYLCRLGLAESGIKRKGKLRAALLEARRYRDWQSRFDVSQYTDVMIACICQYHAIIKLCRGLCNWLDTTDGDLPQTPDKTAISSVAVVLSTLIENKKLLEASQVVHTASTLDESPESVTIHQRWLSAALGQPDQDSEILVFQIALKRVFFAGCLHGLDRKDEAREQLSRANDSLKSFFGGDMETYCPRLATLSRMMLCYIDAATEPVSKIEQYLEMADNARQAGESHIQRVFIRAAFQASDDYVDRGTDPELRAVVSKRREQILLQYLKFELEDAQCDFYIAGCLSMIGFSMQKLQRSSEWLDCLSEFEETGAEFDVPLTGERLYATGEKSAWDQGDALLAKKYRDKSESFRRHCPYMRIGLDGTAGAIEDSPNGYIWEWNQEVPGATNIFERQMFISAKIILRWTLSEYAAGKMTKPVAMIILCYSHEEDFETWKEKLSPAALRDMIYGTPGPREPERWDLWMEVVEPWLKNEQLGPSILHRHNLLKVISNCRKHIWSIHRTVPIPRDILVRSTYEFQNHLDILVSLDPQVYRQNEIWQAESTIARHKLMLGLSAIARAEGLVDDGTLDEARIIIERNVAMYREGGYSEHLHSSLVSLARCSWIRYINFKTTSPSDSLRYLEEADHVYRDMLKSSSILDAPRSFFAKHTLAENTAHHETYKDGIKASVAAWVEYCQKHREEILKDAEAAIKSAEAQELAANMVRWTQRAKARSLTDLIGMGQGIPASFIAEAQKQASAMRLLDAESKFYKELESANAEQKLRIRAELRSLWKEMRAEPALVQIMDIYEGESVNSRELMGMGSAFDEDIIFVDWQQVSWVDAWDLAMLVYRNGLLCGIYNLSLKLEEVEAWVSRHLDTSAMAEDDDTFCPLAGRSASKALRYLEPLIKPLEEITKPGELLVFCPTLALHRVPLHALNMAGMPLICRNPVVYCQSLTLLRLCLLRRILQEDEGGSGGVYAPVLFNPLSNERETAALVKEVAANLGAEPEPAIESKQDFITRASSATLIHFHGHVRFSEADPLEHHLELAPPPEDPSQELSTEQTLTAREIFGISLTPGCHVTTISCKSGRAKISDANELLGMVASLHCAGASSVVSSLWNIHRKDGADFSAYFYNDVFQEQTRFPKPGCEFVDLARAMQLAVVAAQRDDQGRMRAPYHWAGLVLNGAWVMRRDERYRVVAAGSEPGDLEWERLETNDGDDDENKRPRRMTF